MNRSIQLYIVCLFLLVTGTWAQADQTTCPDTAFAQPTSAKALSFLQSIQGSYQLGQCSVELHVCTGQAPVNETGTLVGDLLITDSQGKRSYLQFEFPDASSPQTTVKIQNGRIMFHYEFDDRHPDPVFGNRESIRVEFLKSDDKQALISLEEGWYSTLDRKFRRKGSVYNWTLCHGNLSLKPQSPGPL